MPEYSYDITQYDSHPYAQTHPSHLSMISNLFGVKAPGWKKARILELGCAAGGNIIPLAIEAPEAEIVGIDLSKNQINEGIKHIEALGLKNIKLSHRSITDINQDDGLFDYIICHGVWSWVPEEVRQKIFGIIRNNMSEKGVAYVSYNTLPGWGMVLGVREMMKYHTKHITNHSEKAQQARLLLKFIGDGLQNDNSPYANFLQSEINLLSRQGDHYLLHEYLEEDNNPVYFHNFVEQANQYNLSYLSDTNLAEMFAHNLPEQFSKEISKINDIIRSNQYIDFIRNKRFRCTLLTHSHNKIDRNLSFDKIKKFSLSFSGACNDEIHENSFEEGTPLSFSNGVVTLTVKSSISKRAMWLLKNQKGKPMSFKALCQKTTKELTGVNIKEVESHLIQDLNLLRLVLGGLIHLHEEDGNYTTQPTSRPKVCELAQYQSKFKNYVTNKRHELVAFNPIEHCFFQELDGTKTIKEIIPNLVNAVLKGKAQLVSEDGNPITNKSELENRIPTLCEKMLDKFAGWALLTN